MKDLHMAQDTIPGRVRSCRRFFRFQYPDQKWSPNSLKVQTVNECKLYFFTREEIQAILNHPDHQTFVGYRDYVIMLVFLDTGVRPHGAEQSAA